MVWQRSVLNKCPPNKCTGEGSAHPFQHLIMAPETGEGPLPSRVSFHSRPLGALLYPSSSADAGAGATALVTAEQGQGVALSHLARSLLCCLGAAGVPVQTQASPCRPREPMARELVLAHHRKRYVTTISIDMFADALLRALHHP